MYYCFPESWRKVRSEDVFGLDRPIKSLITRLHKSQQSNFAYHFVQL